MTDTLWSDISEFQIPAGHVYPYGFLMFRSNDGTHLDANFTANLAWCKSAAAAGGLWAYGVYYFYRPGINGASILMDRAGKPGPRLVVMIDVESAGGQVTGDQSAAVNAQHGQLARWLGSAKRVVGYGNVHDLDTLWPSKPAGLRVVVAAYGSNPGYPGKYAHQFRDDAPVPPFGPSDLNSADGMSAHDLQVMYGLAAPPRTAAPPRRHVVPAGNTRTLAQAVAPAEAHDVIALSRTILSTQNLAVLNAYAALNATLRAAGHTTAPMPGGMVFWTAG